MAHGDVDACTIALTGIAPYDGPALFGVGTDLLLNLDTSGGSLVDTVQSDNRANLALEPTPDEIFGSGFNG